MVMVSQGSITSWFQALQGGDRHAAQKLWERCSSRLLGLARQNLQDTPRQMADEEQVALSAFDSFCRGAEKGHFPQLNGRDNLWQLHVVITIRKAVDLHNYERHLKRGGPATPEAQSAQDDSEGGILDRLLGREPGPELAAIMAEECGRLLGRLDDPMLRSIALLRMEGNTDEEIAAQLNCARSTVQRRLRLIRQHWQQEAP